MWKKMRDKFLQKRGSCLKQEVRTSWSRTAHRSHHSHWSAGCVWPWMQDLSLKTQSFHHRPTYIYTHMQEISVSQSSVPITNPQTRTTSALLITPYDVSGSHMTNSLLTINTNLDLSDRKKNRKTDRKKDGRCLMPLQQLRFSYQLSVRAPVTQQLTAARESVTLDVATVSVCGLQIKHQLTLPSFLPSTLNPLSDLMLSKDGGG